MKTSNEVILTSGTQRGQMTLFVLSVLFIFITLLFTLFYSTISLLATFIVQVVFFVILNMSFKNFYDITLTEENLVFHSFWKYKKVPRKALAYIEKHKFVIAYPLNPFIDFVFLDNSRLTTKINYSLKYYTSRGGFEKYIQDLEHLIKQTGD